MDHGDQILLSLAARLDPALQLCGTCLVGALDGQLGKLQGSEGRLENRGASGGVESVQNVKCGNALSYLAVQLLGLLLSLLLKRLPCGHQSGLQGLCVGHSGWGHQGV